MTSRVAEGWSYRGLGAVVLENAALRVTVLPELGGHLEEAAVAGRARVLAPGASLEAEVAFIFFDGLDAVRSVEADGSGFAVR